MKTITVNASSTYDVMIGAGILNDAGAVVRERAGGRAACIVTDDVVDRLYSKQLEMSLAKNGYNVVKYIIPNGEHSKNGEHFLALLNFLANEQFSRTDVVVALGGGVVGDLAGFAAACYMRGVRLVQMPTTLLSAVDSSVGGKTAVNLPAGKNLAGAFYRPNVVICDVSLFETLPDEIYKDGCAEVIKHGAIADKHLFERLKTPINEQYTDVVARNVEIKSGIVAQDEFEKGQRKLLNFGHTVGHAIELLSGYKIAHGRAVAAGMAVETRAAHKLGLCSAECVCDMEEMLTRYGLPVTTDFGVAELAAACLNDKKRDGGSITLVFPAETGRCFLKDIPVAQLEEVVGLGY